MRVGRSLLSFLCLGLVVAAAAQAAPPKWSPAQAAAKVTVAFDVKVQTGGRYTPVVCRGVGKAVAGKFAAFRCSYTYRKTFGGVSTVEQHPVWVKVRANGGGCVSTSAVVPAACLRASAALSGVQDAVAAFRAAYEKRTGSTSQALSSSCVGMDGWYLCEFASASASSDVKGTATVVFTKAGPKVTFA